MTIYSNPKGRGSDVSLYALDSIAFGPNWDVDAGLRWDRFKSSFSEVFSGTGFERTDTFVSPRAAVDLLFVLYTALSLMRRLARL